jgi:uncharacterized protein YecE (DUF72 family)
MIHVGTSGWQYDDWKGAFYPASLRSEAWLTHYATRFATVEVNNSFYRLPERTTFERWRTGTPDGFMFAVKISRFLTHVKRLKDPEEPAQRLLDRAAGLGKKLGPLLLQLPPTMRADPGRLRATLDAFGAGARIAVEFRHPSWFSDEVLSLLDSHGAALVLADRRGVRVPSQPIVTGGWTYLRFHQGTTTHPSYRTPTLSRWADAIADLPARETFIYFNNDPSAAAPRDARRLVAMLAKRGQQVVGVLDPSAATLA